MAKAARKKNPAVAMIEFSRTRDIPFNRIRLSDSNVREIDVEQGLDELTQDIDRREQNRELSGDEAMMMRVGLIQVAVKDPRERVVQIREVIDRHTQQTAARQRALLAQQQRDAKLKDYKAQEARIVSEVLAMQSYPNGMSRDDYLRQRLQDARDTINRTPAPAPVSTP